MIPTTYELEWKSLQLGRKAHGYHLFIVSLVDCKMMAAPTSNINHFMKTAFYTQRLVQYAIDIFTL
jgi:hypothetical protein